jgi:hypothetical protein
MCLAAFWVTGPDHDVISRHQASHPSLACEAFCLMRQEFSEI